jgi:hypothetical protein
MHKIRYEGRTVKIKRLASQQVYRVPDELPDGTRVKIVGFEVGFFIVEHNGAKFSIPLACVDYSSFEPRL